MNQKDRLIYPDPRTRKTVVKQKPISLYEVRNFIDEHMGNKDSEHLRRNSKDRRHLPDGLIPPKYVLKFIEKNGVAEIRVYYDKNVMIGDMIE